MYVYVRIHICIQQRHSLTHSHTLSLSLSLRRDVHGFAPQPPLEHSGLRLYGHIQEKRLVSCKRSTWSCLGEASGYIGEAPYIGETPACRNRNVTHSLSHPVSFALPPSLAHPLSHALPPSLSHPLTHSLPPSPSHPLSLARPPSRCTRPCAPGPLALG